MAKWLNKYEAAEIIGKTPRWMDQQRFAGTGPPFFKVGGRVHYRERDLVDYIAACRVAPAIIKCRVKGSEDHKAELG